MLWIRLSVCLAVSTPVALQLCIFGQWLMNTNRKPVLKITLTHWSSWRRTVRESQVAETATKPSPAPLRSIRYVVAPRSSRINKVTRRRARLVLGWVTVSERVYRLGIKRVLPVTAILLVQRHRRICRTGKSAVYSTGSSAVNGAGLGV